MPPLTHCALLVRQSKETALNSVQEGWLSNNLVIIYLALQVQKICLTWSSH